MIPFQLDICSHIYAVLKLFRYVETNGFIHYTKRTSPVFQTKSPLAKRETECGMLTPRFYPVKENAASDSSQPRKYKTRHSENPPVEMPVGWVFGTRSRTSSVNA